LTYTVLAGPLVTAIEARERDVSGPAPGHPARAVTITANNKADTGLKKHFDMSNLSPLKQAAIADSSEQLVIAPVLS
jgi:hypothetical protein